MIYLKYFEKLEIGRQPEVGDVFVYYKDEKKYILEVVKKDLFYDTFSKFLYTICYFVYDENIDSWLEIFSMQNVVATRIKPENFLSKDEENMLKKYKRKLDAEKFGL